MSELKTCLSSSQRKIAQAFAEVMFPPGQGFDLSHKDIPIVPRLEDHLYYYPYYTRIFMKIVLWILQWTPFLFGFGLRRATALSLDERNRLLEQWDNLSIYPFNSLTTALKALYGFCIYNFPEVLETFGYSLEKKTAPPAKAPEGRPLARMDLPVVKGDVREEVDVCVIGSGAGGAVVARELAERGHSVVILEEGGYYTSGDFNARATEMIKYLWRDAAQMMMLGHPAVSIGAGKCVGGTTTINSAVCIRIPPEVLKEWQLKTGLFDLTMEELAPYYSQVEQIINVEEVTPEIAGKSALVFKEGAEKLGYNASFMKHNIKNCERRGVCQYGCPIDVKQSMNISYLPLAVKAGARLYPRCRAEKIRTSNGAARVVQGYFLDQEDRKTHRMEVKARVVIVAAGSLFSPFLLQKNRLANSSRQVGKNLHVHPAARVWAQMDEEITLHNGHTHSVEVQDFFSEGFMLEGIIYPPDVAAAISPGVGYAHKQWMSQYNYMASFGIMICDTSTGRVLPYGIKGRPTILYDLNDRDFDAYLKGVAVTAEIFFAAGARKVWTCINRVPPLTDVKDIPALFDGRIKKTDCFLMGFHPHGTCRMGSNPKNSVVNSFGETHDVGNLFVCDASIFPSTLRVNPQLTIMALATRSAEHIHARLS